MFSCKDSTITGSGGASVLGRFGVTVVLEGEAPVRLAFLSGEGTSGTDKHGAFEQQVLHYGDGAEKAAVSVSLTLRCYADMVLGFVNGRVHNEYVFGKRKSFSGLRGIAITVERIENVRGLMAIHQHNQWWNRPHFDLDPEKLPSRTLSLLWRTDTSYYRLLPVTGPVFRTDLAGGEGAAGQAEDGAQEQGFSIVLSVFQGGLLSQQGLAFVLGYGDDPYALADRTTEAALLELDYPALPRSSKKYPEVLDSLGWCSWDAFYKKVDEQGVLQKAEEFNRLGLPVRWMMIDDGWSTTADGKLQAWDADSGKFPQGLAHTVRQLKERHGVRWVGVWHTIVGYWAGVHPDSEIARSLSRFLYKAADGSLLPYPDPALGFGFWNTWHGYLSRQGIDFVKVDSQASINNYLQYERAVGASASAAHQALEASVALHFDGAVINCMGMAPENVWHRPRSAVSRNSDDFFPKVRHSFREHALQNAYNSYWHGPFYWGDWDMFWSSNHDDVQNAVLRAVSGGPVYVSDQVGRTNAEVLKPLAYSDGRLLRCEKPALPTGDCLMQDPTSEAVPLKLWNMAGAAGIVAAFHIGADEVERAGVVSAADVPGLTEGRVLLYEYFSRECRVLEKGETFPFVLRQEQSKLFVLVPVRSGGDVTPVGLTNKYVASHAVLEQTSRGGMEVIRLREGGRFLFYSEQQPMRVVANGVELQADPIGSGFYEVDCSDRLQEVWVEVELRQ
ncbi:Sip1-related alpha-galactosidase [Paenibacillus koleovorans]|uniref:Sip1-related alpha-galactosidase n=1 Tax=Paenibacillus koleovorans TaxID=121608 RepID=UPI000FDAD358|nr:Sip1-related alpha-galactosidase [Paenibacillus koleovorans]